MNMLAELVQHVVAEAYAISPKDIMAAGRHKAQAEARQVFMMLMREHGLSTTEIGRLLSRDHTTVVQGVQSIKRRLEEPLIAHKLACIRQALRERSNGLIK